MDRRQSDNSETDILDANDDAVFDDNNNNNTSTGNNSEIASDYDQTGKSSLLEHFELLILPDMIRLSREMRDMMTTSERAIQHLVESTRHMDRTLDKVEEPARNSINEIQRVRNLASNTETTVPYLEDLCEVMRLVDKDRLKIKQGPKTTIGEYIDKLAKIKKFERFSWVNSIEYGAKDVFSSQKTIKSHYTEYMTIMQRGEKILVQEFIGW